MFFTISNFEVKRILKAIHCFLKTIYHGLGSFMFKIYYFLVETFWKFFCEYLIKYQVYL